MKFCGGAFAFLSDKELITHTSCIFEDNSFLSPCICCFVHSLKPSVLIPTESLKPQKVGPKISEDLKSIVQVKMGQQSSFIKVEVVPNGTFFPQKWSLRTICHNGVLIQTSERAKGWVYRCC